MVEQTQHVTVELGESTTIVVVADSHSLPHGDAYKRIAEQDPGAILHAGDIGKLAILDELQEIAPTYAVRGNIDGHAQETPDHLVIEVTRAERLQFRVLLTHIAVYGPRLRKDAWQRARRQAAHLVICGHSHVPLIAQEGKLAVFNPGSLGPRRFQLPITFGVLDLSAGRLQLHHVDCETGETWLPPGL